MGPEPSAAVWRAVAVKQTSVMGKLVLFQNCKRVQDDDDDDDDDDDYDYDNNIY